MSVKKHVVDVERSTFECCELHGRSEVTYDFRCSCGWKFSSLSRIVDDNVHRVAAEAAADARWDH